MHALAVPVTGMSYGNLCSENMSLGTDNSVLKAGGLFNAIEKSSQRRFKD